MGLVLARQRHEPVFATLPAKYCLNTQRSWTGVHNRGQLRKSGKKIQSSLFAPHIAVHPAVACPLLVSSAYLAAGALDQRACAKMFPNVSRNKRPDGRCNYNVMD